MSETTPGPDAVVSGEFLADKLRIAYGSVNRLAKEGVIPVAGRGRFPLWACIGAYCERLREQAAGRAASDDEDGLPDLARERALLARAQREGQAMKNAVLRGELLPVDDVEAVVGAVLDATKAKVQALPTKLAPRCVGLKHLTEARDVLAAGVTEAYDELSTTPVVVASAVDRARKRIGRRAAGDTLDEAPEAPAPTDGLGVE